MANSYHGVGWGTGIGYYLIACFLLLLFLFVLLAFGLSCPVSFLSEWSVIAVVCFFVYYLFSLSLVPITSSYWGIEIVGSVM